MHFALSHIIGIATLLGSALALSIPFAFGASLTTEAPVLTQRRVTAAMEQMGTPGAAALFRAFESWLMQQRAGVNLQFISIADLTDDSNDLDGAIRVYAVYLKKQNTATDAFWRLFDNASTSGTAGDLKMVLPCLESGKESIAFFPDGFPLALGIVQTAQTTGNGTTDTTTGDGPNGFLLVGA